MSGRGSGESVPVNVDNGTVACASGYDGVASDTSVAVWKDFALGGSCSGNANARLGLRMFDASGESVSTSAVACASGYVGVATVTCFAVWKDSALGGSCTGSANDRPQRPATT